MVDKVAEALGVVHYYHSHKVNQLIHVICTPFILLGLLTFTAYVIPTYAFLALSIAAPIGYIVHLYNWDHLVTTIWAFAYVGLSYTSHSLVAEGGAVQSLFDLFVVWLLLLVIPGFIQVRVGHHVFQKRNPEFDLYDGAVLTPFYVVATVLFFFGYNEDLRRRMEREAAKLEITGHGLYLKKKNQD